MGMVCCAMLVEGVLVRSAEQWYKPVKEGMRLLKSLQRDYSVHLITSADSVTVDLYRSHGILEGAVSTTQVFDPFPLRESFAGLRRRTGMIMDFAVVPDPALAEALFTDGWNVLLAAYPAYAREEWRPDSLKQPVSFQMLAARIGREGADAWADAAELAKREERE